MPVSHGVFAQGSATYNNEPQVLVSTPTQSTAGTFARITFWFTGGDFDDLNTPCFTVLQGTGLSGSTIATSNQTFFITYDTAPTTSYTVVINGVEGSGNECGGALLAEQFVKE